MNIDRNQFLMESLPGLSTGDAAIQKAVYQQFYDELHHHAWNWIKHEEYGHDAATIALLAFFVRCQNGPFTDESNLVGYLYECVTKAVQKLWDRHFRYPHQQAITAIVPGYPVQVIVADHGLTGRETFSVSHSNTKPSLNGEYGGQSTPYVVVDRDTLEFLREVQPGGSLGILHVRRRRPFEASFQSTSIGEDSPSWEPQDHQKNPASDLLNSTADPRSQSLEQLINKYGHGLTDMERLILTMKEFGRTDEEIGKKIGRTADNVRKTDLPNALKKLRAAMARSGGLDDERPGDQLGR
jgi:hypothetical protein